MEALQLEKLNQKISSAHIDARLAHILNKLKDQVLITTSLGTTSALLIHMISRIRPDHPIHFINTGYIFPETIDYKNLLVERYNVNLVEHHPDEEKHKISRETHMWEKKPDLCCHYNKVDVLRKVKENHKVWVSGLLGYQNNYRSGLNFIQKKDDLHRYYPLIDWTQKMVEEYFEHYQLPRHPLERFGFDSVGCTHCTIQGNNRDGRWNSNQKTECGLHL